MIAAVLSTSGLRLGHRWLMESPRFAIQSIELVGASHVAIADIHRLGVRRGVNAFALDLERLERAIEDSPWVASATIHRELPSRVVVEVTERQAAGLVELEGLYLVDSDGMPFKRASIAAGEGRDLPVITGLSRDEFLANQPRAIDRIRSAIAVHRAYSERDGRPAIGEIHLHPRRGLTFYTDAQAAEIALGDVAEPDALDRRLAAFDRAWNALDQRERSLMASVFLNNATRPNRVTVGMREADGE